MSAIVWTGTANDGDLGNAGNFNGSAVPQAGDTLEIPCALATKYPSKGTCVCPVHITQATQTMTIGHIDGGTFSSTVLNDCYGTLGVGTAYGGSINGGTFNGAVTNNFYINGQTYGAVFNSTVQNNWQVNGGTFNGAVNNANTIMGGTFNAAVTVDTILGWNSVSPIYGGTFNSTLNTISTIVGGVFKGTVTASATCSIQYQASYALPTFYGAVNSAGYLLNGVFFGPVTCSYRLRGGTYYGKVTNTGVITILAPNPLVFFGPVFSNTAIAAGTTFSGDLTINGVKVQSASFNTLLVP